IYSGEVTNPRELEAMQEKNRELDRKVQAAEGQSDAIDEGITAKLKEAEKSAAALKELKIKFDASQGSLKDTHANLETQLEEYNKKLNSLAKKINKKLLAEFLEKRKVNGGRLYAIVIQNNICSLCHRTLTRATLDRLNSGKEVYCDNCNRRLLK
ncbi:MAG: hypothetical protein Q4C00_06435, partial [Bacillota bacterium]|nr:hypothetical protein [Bacillota bacterium]